MLTQTHTVFFIGVPSAQERLFLVILHERYQVHMLGHASEAYRYLAHILPDIVIFSANQANTAALKLFRRLRRLERVCVIACGAQIIQGFTGKKYQRRRDISNSQENFQKLLDWLERFSSFVKFDHSNREPQRPSVSLEPISIYA